MAEAVVIDCPLWLHSSRRLASMAKHSKSVRFEPERSKSSFIILRPPKNMQIAFQGIERDSFIDVTIASIHHA